MAVYMTLKILMKSPKTFLLHRNRKHTEWKEEYENPI